MTSQNLGIVFAPIIVRDESHDNVTESDKNLSLISALTGTSGSSSAVSYLIQEAPTLFEKLENWHDSNDLNNLVKHLNPTPTNSLNSSSDISISQSSNLFDVLKSVDVSNDWKKIDEFNVAYKLKLPRSEDTLS